MAEQTKPPGIASSSTRKLGDWRSAFGMSSGTTGRSFTTQSPRFPCTRRARTTTPCSLSARSGVSKKKTCLIWASSGSTLSARAVSNCAVSGTVSFSSTLSALAASFSSSASRSSESVGRLGGAGVTRARFQSAGMPGKGVRMRTYRPTPGDTRARAARLCDHFVMRPAATAISAVQRRVEDAVLAAVEDSLDRAIANGLVERIVDRLVAEGVIERAVDRVFDEQRVIDEIVKRLIESEGLWVLVDEIAQSPAVTEAIGRQSIGFADQVAGEVRKRSRSADARLERVARRALRRPLRESPAGTMTTSYEGLVTRSIAFAIDAAVINLVAIAVGAIVALAVSVLSVPDWVDTALAFLGGAPTSSGRSPTSPPSGRRPARRPATG